MTGGNGMAHCIRSTVVASYLYLLQRVRWLAIRVQGDLNNIPLLQRALHVVLVLLGLRVGALCDTM